MIKQLMSNYEKLAPVEQMLLQLCSVIYESTNKTNLFKCFKQVSKRLFPKLQFKNPTAISHYIKNLQTKNLLEDGYTCNELVLEKLSKLAMDQETYPLMAEAVRDVYPLTEETSYSYRKTTSSIRKIREMRIAIYTCDKELCQKMYRSVKKDFQDQQYDRYFIELINKSFIQDVFFLLAMEMRITILQDIFSGAVLYSINDADALKYALDKQFLDSIPTNLKEGFYHSLISRLLFDYRLEQAKQLVQQLTKSAYSSGLMGSLHYLEKGGDQAIEAFEIGLSELKKGSKKKFIFFDNLSGIFYLLALLSAKKPDYLERSQNYLSSVLSSKSSQIKAIKPFFLAIKVIILILQYKHDQAKNMLNNLYDIKGILGFFIILGSYMLDDSLSSDELKQLEFIGQNSYRHNMKWLLTESVSLLKLVRKPKLLFEKETSKFIIKSKITAFVDSIPFVKPWQKKINQLQALINPQQTGPSSQHQYQNKRLIWILSVNKSNIDLEPIEQSLTAKNSWTKGRPVAMSRLYSGKNLDYLSDQDNLIRGTIDKEYDNYYGTSYSFDMNKVLPFLIGHPLLFSDGVLSVNIEISQGEPEIKLTQTGSKLHLEFSPYCKSPGSEVIKLSSTSYQIVKLSKDHVSISNILGEKGLTVPMSAKSEILSMISRISSLVTVHSAIAETIDEIELVTSDSMPYLHFIASGSGYLVKMFTRPLPAKGPYLKPGHGAELVIAEIDGRKIQIKRDLKQEQQKADLVEEKSPTLKSFDLANQEWFLPGKTECLQVLHELKNLEADQQLSIVWPEGESLRIDYEASLDQLHLTVESKTDWFEFTGELRINDSLTVEIDKLYEMLEYSDSSFLQLQGGQFIALTSDFRKRIQDFKQHSTLKNKKIQLNPYSSIILEDFFDSLQNLEADKTWKAKVQKIKKGYDISTEIPSTFRGELRDYQFEGFGWLCRLAYWGVGGCLADDMGLGKTIQALALILNRANEGASLVVAPTSVCLNWQRETNRFTPTLNPVIFGVGNRQEQVKDLKAFDLLIVSYGLLLQEEELICSQNWNTIILDEAQAIKNVAAKRSQAARKLQGKFKLITTGTPIENHLGELYSLYNFINPGLLGSLKSFNQKFANPIEKEKDKLVKRQLKKMIQPFILRRLKSEVLDELPSRTEIVLSVDMETEEKAFYEALRQEALQKLAGKPGEAKDNHFMILAEIMRLRRACCNPRLIVPEINISSSKLNVFWEVVSELLENKHKALVFSQFVGHLTLIREFLDDKKIDYGYLDGSTPAKERQRQVDAFQAGQGDLFLISLKAGGIGLNLTAADYVIHMDPWWNPAVEDQASDRAHRIGQKNPVTIYRLVTKGTIEEKILTLHYKKRHLANSLLDGSDISGKISADELLKLIQEQEHAIF